MTAPVSAAAPAKEDTYLATDGVVVEYTTHIYVQQNVTGGFTGGFF